MVVVTQYDKPTQQSVHNGTKTHHKFTDLISQIKCFPLPSRSRPLRSADVVIRQPDDSKLFPLAFKSNANIICRPRENKLFRFVPFTEQST
jgi:hypothetical protein